MENVHSNLSIPGQYFFIYYYYVRLESVSDGFNSLCYVLGADGEDSDG